MPVLAANQVTLAEVLEVKGVPLNEEEIWAILCQAGKELELLLAQGKGKYHGQPALLISPETLILSYLGQVKVSVVSGREKTKNITYRAPELSSRTVAPSNGAVEKMYVYSLGMTAYFAAEYEQSKSKMVQLSVSLGNLLLYMCEELARARYTLRQVLEACGSKYGEDSYQEIIKGLVVLVLGSNIPEVSQNDSIPKLRTLWKSYSSDEQHPSRGIRSRYGSGSLELPSPPLVQRVTHGQATVAEHVGSNDRTSSSPEEQHAYHSQNKFMTKIPHTLDKYRKYLEKARHKKTASAPSPVVPDRSIDLGNGYGSMRGINGNHFIGSELPLKRHRFERAQSYPEEDRGYKEDKGYEEGNADVWLSRSRSEKLRSAGSGSFGNLVHSSDASSETSSISDNHKSILSSAQSSSLLSLMEGSYVPGSSLTDRCSNFWGSVGSMRDNSGLGDSGEWHRSSVGDLRSVSELSNTEHGVKQHNSITDMQQWPVSNGQLDKQKKYHSEQNLVSPDSSEGGKRQRKVKAKLRKFFGPEFVKITEDPDKSLINITPTKDKKKVSGRRLVTVVMLNEQKLEMAVESSTKVQELFTQITKYIGITEKIYFGLARLEDDEHFFLDFDSKLSKYAPSGWKEKSKKTTREYTLYFRVKFYVENLSLLRHHATTHQLYLQLRSDILHDRFHCNDEAALNLASLAVQAEYGNYSMKRFGEDYFKPKHYLSSRVLVKMGEDVSSKLCALHKIQCGLEQEEAESKFIKEAQKLPEYGIHIYKTKWNKQENQSIYLGISVRGVTVYETKGNHKSPVEQHSWNMIKKLAFKKKKFFIEPRIERQSGKGNKITFLNSSYKKSKYLLYMCTSFHRFQMRMKVRLLSMDDNPKDQKGRTSSSQPHKTTSFDQLNDEGYNGGGPPVNDGVENNGLDDNFEEENADSRRPSDVSREISEYNDLSLSSHTVNDEQSTRASPYLLDSSPGSPSAFSDRTPSSQQARGMSDAILSPDRKVKIIKLRKDSRGALGLTVVGGEDTRRLHLGIFIKIITVGSAAEQDGRLQVGDRILAVNEKSLEYVNHDEAVQTLKNAPVEVELLVSQSIRTEGANIDMSAMASPAAVNKLPSSLSHNERTSPPPHPFQEKNPPVNRNAVRRHYNHDTPVVSDNRESPKPPAYKNIYKPRRTSASSTGVAVSKPSAPEPATRVKPRGGIKLPGMHDDLVLEDAGPPRNGPFASSLNSHVSEESPGSIASFGEKIHRKSSLPQPVSALQQLHEEARTFPLGSPPDDVGLRRSASDSGARQEDDEETDGRIETTGESHNSDVIGRASTSGGGELNVEQRNSECDLSQLPVGVVWENKEEKNTEDNLQVQSNNFSVELDKESGSLGLNVTGGINTSVRDGAIYVKSLYPNGPADLDGRIQVAHKIISVNGISLQGVTHKQAVETIKRAPLRTVLVIEGLPPVDNSPSINQGDNQPQSQENEKESLFEVVLVKGIGGLGMSLVGGTDYVEEYGEAIRIKAMFPGQPAMNSEQLRIGDVILAANGISLEGKTNRDAINVLRDQPPRVVLSVKRDPATIPPGLLRRGSFSQNLDPDEMLSVIHSKLLREDSRTSEASVNSDNHESTSEMRERRVSHESDIRKKSDESLRWNGDEEDTHDSQMMMVHENEINAPLPNQQFNDGENVASLPSSVDYSFNLQPPPDGSGYVNGDDVFLESAGQDNDRRRSSAYSHVVEDDVERRLSTNSGQPWSEASSSDENKNEKLAPDEEVIDLVLYKGSSGLGFTLAGGADTVGGCFVREIIGDPARSDGRLRPKDQIVMVNGQDTTNKKHMEAVNILRSTRDEVHLVVRRRPDKLKSSTKDGLDIKTVSVIRTTRGRIGLTLAEDKEGQIYAEDVVPDEPAAKDGGLKSGDIIIEINGERVDRTGLQFAVHCLDKARPVVTIVIKQFRSETESKYVLSSPTESELEHQILKPQELPLNEFDTQEQTHRKYSQDKYTPEQISVKKPSQGQRPDQPLLVRQSQIQQSDVLPHNKQPPEHATSERLPTGAQPLMTPSPMGNRPALNQNYSRYKFSESLESLEQFNAELKVMSRESSEKEEELSEAEDGDSEGKPDEDDESADEEDDHIVIKEEVFVTTLDKGPRGLGFSLFSGRTIHDSPGLFIRSIQPNSIVAEDGKIKIGDQLLKVNDVNVETLDHSEVITILRRLSGNIKLEMLRIQDADEEEDGPSLAAEPPDGVIQSSETLSPEVINEELSQEYEGVVSTAATPDFSEDLSIVLSALDKNHDLHSLDVKSETSLNDPAGSMLNSRNSSQSSLQAISPERLRTETKEDNEKQFERWPKPPTTLELQVSNLTGSSAVVQDMKDVDHNDNLLTTSEDDNVSVSFSEDGFLEQLEDLQYTPSPDAEARRPGFGLGGSQSSPTTLDDRRASITDQGCSQNLGISIDSRSSGVSRIPVMQGSSVSKDFRAGLNNLESSKGGRNSSVSGEENIEMSLFNRDDSKETAYLSTSRESTPRTKDDCSGSSVSSLISSSFLDPSQAISPEVPPPIPTTPVPSDDDVGGNLGPTPPQRVQSLQGMRTRERLEKVVKEETMPKGRFDYPLRPKSPLVMRRSPPSIQPTGAMIEIQEQSARYSGECLKHAVRKLQDAISSGQATKEFQALREVKAVDSCPSGKRALNKDKNRYKNVLPYEKTRVILSGDEQMDYINANYVDITVGSDVYHYIATQGPLPITTGDFWKMVWEQRSQVIAMVTLDMESGKVKCHRYWPESPELPVKVYNSLEVHLEAVETHTNFVQRRITIKNLENSEFLKVVHLNFVAWPDHGVPKSACELVDFIKEIRSYANSGPCVVHCSAGIGRTGTLLTVDTCLRHIEKGLEFDIYAIVRHLREHRPGMIQTKDQYLLCYQACVEVLTSLESHM